MPSLFKEDGLVPESYPLDGRTIEVGDSKNILEYWEDVRGEKFAPAFGSEFRLVDLSAEILPCVSVVDVVNGGENFRYRFWGTRNVQIKGFEMTGKLLDEGPVPEVREVGQAQFSEVLKRRYPVAFAYRGPYATLDHLQQITFRYPLSSDGETIDGIFSWQNLNDPSGTWREFFKEFWSAKNGEAAGKDF